MAEVAVCDPQPPGPDRCLSAAWLPLREAGRPGLGTPGTSAEGTGLRDRGGFRFELGCSSVAARSPSAWREANGRGPWGEGPKAS